MPAGGHQSFSPSARLISGPPTLAMLRVVCILSMFWSRYSYNNVIEYMRLNIPPNLSPSQSHPSPGCHDSPAANNRQDYVLSFSGDYVNPKKLRATANTNRHWVKETTNISTEQETLVQTDSDHGHCPWLQDEEGMVQWPIVDCMHLTINPRGTFFLIIKLKVHLSLYNSTYHHRLHWESQQTNTVWNASIVAMSP